MIEDDRLEDYFEIAIEGAAALLLIPLFLVVAVAVLPFWCVGRIIRKFDS